jgi:hypothetical protein
LSWATRPDVGCYKQGLLFNSLLRLDQVLLSVFVDEFDAGVGAAGEELNVGRVRFATQADCRAVFGRGDFDVGSPMGIDQPQQHCLRIAVCGWKYFDHGANPSAVIDDFQATAAQHRSNCRRRGRIGAKQVEGQEQKVDEGEAEGESLSSHLGQV